MTTGALNTPAAGEQGENARGERRGSNVSDSSYLQVMPANPDSASLLRVETMSNADLYCMTPPAYCQSVGDNEVSVDAEAVQNEKAGPPGSAYAPSHISQQGEELDRHISERSSLLNRDLEGAAGPSGLNPSPSPGTPHQHIPNDMPPVYLSIQQRDTVMASVKKCAILPNRQAVWMVKRRNFALSPLAATILMKEGIVKEKDLELISPSAGAKRDPNDPLSGIAFATYDTVGDILMGLVEGPVEAARQVVKLDEAKRGNPRGAEQSSPSASSPQDPISLTRQNTAPPAPETAPTDQNQRDASWKPPQGPPAAASHRRSTSTFEAPNAAKEVAISTGKGLGRIVGATVKAPMTFTHGITRGFHNLPKLYGDEVREYENITDIRSGLEVSAKSFGHGVGDGLRDFFIQPVLGAQKEGGMGFVKGFGKGVGNLVCKPSAGIVGIVGYSSMGVYKQFRSLKPGGQDDTTRAFIEHGEVEYQQAPDQTRSEVVRRWCQMTMRSR